MNMLNQGRKNLCPLSMFEVGASSNVLAVREEPDSDMACEKIL